MRVGFTRNLDDCEDLPKTLNEVIHTGREYGELMQRTEAAYYEEAWIMYGTTEWPNPTSQKVVK